MSSATTPSVLARSSTKKSAQSLEHALARATTIVREHRGLLDRLARELIGRESLDAPALERIFQMG